MRFSVASVGFALLAAADAQTLSCNVGAGMDLEGTVSACTTSDKRYKDNSPFDGPTGTTCEGDQFACLSGKWAGDFDTAYGCFGGGSDGGVNQIENAKEKIIAACQSSPTCIENNPNGVPVRGWTSCTTADCNPCDAPLSGGAGIGAPSLVVGVGALLLSFIVQV